MLAPWNYLWRASVIRRHGLFCLLVFLFLGGCADEPSSPNLVLITTDTTRADHLGSYGYPKDTTPNLDKLAQKGVRFERAFAHVPITLPSHTSILSGTIPPFHGVRDNGGFMVRKDLVTLPEILKDQGYATAAFVSAFVLDSRYGLDEGFDVYDDQYKAQWSEEKLRDARIYNQMITDRPADQTTDRALKWLEQQGDQPFFMWIHYYDPHQRYDPPHPFNQIFRDNLYDGEIAFMDQEIGKVFQALKKRQLWDDTAVVVTGDHGEGLGEHGETTHAVLSYDSTLRVGLIIKPPGTTGIAPRVVQEPVSHVDILPTLGDILEVDLPDNLHGRSLVRAMLGQNSKQRPAYFENSLPYFSFGWESVWGIRHQGWKYIHAPHRELYRVAEDPQERFNLIQKEEDQSRVMETMLFAMADRYSLPEDAQSGTVAMDAETRQKLLALGYTGSSGTGGTHLQPKAPTGRRDPAEGVTFLPDFYLANGLAERGRLRDAAQIFESTLVPLDPDNLSFLTHLANLKRRLGHGDEAVLYYRRAQAINPEDASILVEIGQLEVDRGNLEAAEDLFESARQMAPSNVSATYFSAQVAARRGRSEVAVERYRELLVVDDSHRDTLINLGVELAKLGELEEGRQHLRQALTIAPFFPRAHFNLGHLELEAGEPQRAAKSFRRALRYRKRYPQAHLGLALALMELEDWTGAREELKVLQERFPRHPAAGKAEGLLTQLDE